MPKDYWKSKEELRVPEHLDLDILKGALYGNINVTIFNGDS